MNHQLGVGLTEPFYFLQWISFSYALGCSTACLSLQHLNLLPLLYNYSPTLHSCLPSARSHIDLPNGQFMHLAFSPWKLSVLINQTNMEGALVFLLYKPGGLWKIVGGTNNWRICLWHLPFYLQLIFTCSKHTMSGHITSYLVFHVANLQSRIFLHIWSCQHVEIPSLSVDDLS